MLRGLLFGTLAAAIAAAQGTQPKDKPEAYPAHAKLEKITIAAENWGHGFTTPEGAFGLDDYIAVEVAVYTPANHPVQLSTGHFTLRLNEKGTPLLAQAPGMVAASMKYPDWEQPRELVGTVGVGDGSVILGRQPRTERFPGDQRTRPPAGGVPRAPEPENQPGVERKPKMQPLEIVTRASLPEGLPHPPVSGFLFFPYRGKLKSLKSVELLYEGPAGSAVLGLP
jgi:hypothetical protein